MEELKKLLLELLNERGPVSIDIDTDHIVIPIKRYEELLRAETELSAIYSVQQNVSSYALADTIEMLRKALHPELSNPEGTPEAAPDAE